MLTNATILRIDRAGGHAADGRPRVTTGAATVIRCTLDAISSRQRYALGATLADAGHTLYVERGSLQGEAVPAPGDRLSIRPDHASQAYTAVVVALGDRLGPQAGGLSHLECFMRRVPI